MNIIKKIAKKDQTGVLDCIDIYGDFIWALARKFTDSSEEAEVATHEIFQDIWRYAEKMDKHPIDEKFLISLIAQRRLRIKPDQIQ